MSNILDVQRKIFTSAADRKEFAADPRGYLTKAGVPIPDSIALPKSLPLADFEKRITDVEKQLQAKGVNVNNLTGDELRKAQVANVQGLESLAPAGKAAIPAMKAETLVVVVVGVAVATWAVL
jgi:hypothetical protein